MTYCGRIAMKLVMHANGVEVLASTPGTSGYSEIPGRRR
ncbi:hypothetical protein WQQ_29460 [Hydrocarboniphaga effusa AP103]|uniref:Uncharacterized protein n=1 Tax=Hydrocarboniphaga effusa AP103 TaxID=1172194 RepID=I7ZBV2_9GAMM|nr:hypothetical protein WQQ_29460 [Hydrocarboniphaga effusa AP103]